jgi:hypothetical protein
MTRKDFINGILFEYNGRTWRFETGTESNPDAATGCTWINKGVTIGEFIHMDLKEKAGVRFWTYMSGIWLESTIVRYSVFKLISTPAVQEPSAQGA